MTYQKLTSQKARTMTPKFLLGQLVATHGALAALEEAEESTSELIFRHVTGDWGEVCDEDKTLNDNALEHGERLLSSYTTSKGVKIWVITEADRSSTCLLLPEEY